MKIILILLCFLLCCSSFSCNTERSFNNDIYNIEVAVKYRRIGIPISLNIVQVCYRNELYNVEIEPLYENSTNFKIRKIMPILDESSLKIKKCSNITIPGWE